MSKSKTAESTSACYSRAQELAVDVEVASVPSQEVENGRRDYLLKTIIELSTILWQDGSCQGELGEWQERS